MKHYEASEAAYKNGYELGKTAEFLIENGVTLADNPTEKGGGEE